MVATLFEVRSLLPNAQILETSPNWSEIRAAYLQNVPAWEET